MRVARMVAALITVVGLALAGGCGSGGTGGAAAVGTADPTEQLVAGIRAVNSAPFRLVESTTVNTVSNKTEGVGDPARRALRLTRTDSVAGKATTTAFILFDADGYVRFEQSPFPSVPAGTWLRIDARRLPSPQVLGVGTDDMTGKLAIAGAIVTIRRTGTRELHGTYDISKASSVMPRATGVLGDEERTARWQARFDERNRLVWMRADLPRGDGLPDIVTESAYSGFGEPVGIEPPPAGSTVAAPESLYQVLGR